MKELPEDFEKNFDKVNVDEIEVGDFIIYKTKSRPSYNKVERKANGEMQPERYCQGYISMIPNDKGKELWKNQEGTILGFKNRGISWTANSSNVLEFYKSKLSSEDLREASLKKAAEGRQRKQKKNIEEAKAEQVVGEENKKKSRKVELNPKQLEEINNEIQKDMDEATKEKEPVIEEPPKEKSKTPRKYYPRKKKQQTSE